MGIFSRLFKVGEAKAHHLLDKMEKPELMLEQAIRDQEKAIREAKQKVQSVIATERKTKAILEKEKQEKLNWEDRAQTALQGGNEDLATRALVRSEEHGNRATTLQPTWETQRGSVQTLKVDIQKMEDELAELKRNKDIIIAQSKSAEVKKSIYEAKAKIGKNNTGDLIARMKAKAERQSYEAEAAKEMAEDLGGKDSLEKEFEKLPPSSSATVKSKLEALKVKLNS